MNFVDLYSFGLHKIVAQKLRTDESGVLKVARRNLRNWLSSGRFDGGAERALLEWNEIIEHSTVDDLISLITQDNDEGQRLRSSSPFAGVLTKSEREKIWSECAEIRPA